MSGGPDDLRADGRPAPAPGPHDSQRRRFVQALALAGMGGPLAWPNAAWPYATSSYAAWPYSPAANQAFGVPLLDGPRLDLIIGPTRVDVTGRAKAATLVNGSLPGPILRLRQGDEAIIHVSNRLAVPTSIHWHGLRLPADQDGVPGLTFAGIAPGTTFTYRFPIRQSGTYWYHSHSGMQEQTGLSGPLLLLPRTPDRYGGLREHIIMLTDWTDEDPMTVLSNLKQQSDYYDHQQPTLAALLDSARRIGWRAALRQRRTWARMRMDPSDIMDVTGSTYTFLANGLPPAANWTGLFTPNEKLRLRFINGASMTTFDVRIPGLPLTVIAADGSDVAPVEVDEFRIGVAETYDVIVQPGALAYTVFAQAEDRSGYARATLAPHAGMSAAVPPMDPRPTRTLADMGAMSGTPGPGGTHSSDMSDMPDMAGMSDMSDMPGMPGMSNTSSKPGMSSLPSRLDEAGNGLDGDGRRALRYSDLVALQPDPDPRPAARTIEFHLTGNMQRYVWGFDNKQFSQSEPVRIRLGERVRFVLINDTMMEHPIHLHGFLFSLENGHEGRLPLKHTVNVKPASCVSFVFSADTPGHWAFHCHLLYHMESGMFRTVLVA